MNLVTDVVTVTENFKRDVLFWGKPPQAVLMMNIAFFGCITAYLSLIFLPLRWLCVLGLWIGTMSNSEFVMTLAKSFFKRLQKVDTNELRENTLTKVSEIKISIVNKVLTVTNLVI